MLRTTLASLRTSAPRHRPAAAATTALSWSPSAAPVLASFTQKTSRLSFHFASSDYAASFQGVPVPDIPKIRQSAVEYLEQFDPQSWYDDPVR
jgi:hypothetical protein